MPGMGGHKCLQELLKYDPGVKVVIATGYSPYSQQAEAAAAGAAGYIAKPFRRENLLRVVRAVLDGQRQK